MTEPTYSELEAENLRVRGLLQRQWISVEERLPELNQVVLLLNAGDIEMGLRGLDGHDWFWCDLDGTISEKFYEFGEGSTVTHWQAIIPPTFPESSSLVSQGAESADIGKLDAADKSVDLSSGIPPDVWLNGGTQMCCNKSCPKYSPVASITCRRCMCSAVNEHTLHDAGFQFAAHGLRDITNRQAPVQFVDEGSAETGGEKAAPHKCAECSAVQGEPHMKRCSFWGLVAESREPEKLNNAQKDDLAWRTLLWRRHGCPIMALYGDDGELQCAKCHIDFKRMSAEDISTRFLKLGFMALAESSLSSPPPEICTCPPMHLAPCPLSTPANYVVAPEKK